MAELPDPLEDFDPLAAAEQALARIYGEPEAPKNRKARRRKRPGGGAGLGKHPLGATKPLLAERRSARRRKG